MQRILIIFPTTHNLFLAEEIIQKENYSYEIVPTPDDEEDCCSLSIEIEGYDKKDLEYLLKEEFIEYKKIVYL
ncbi:DUF3343 domain-containing protein [Orenia marismortui]|uniref:Uncharacterized protein DUF3343 n=1 Tax=Orenia marismortui TaxID=46469 RepID=A0A4R8H0Z9_9FIRM|nr:DUF3343 domain-containing protein [Orenia marismortui]TDX53232.1 uncharacterized protein DUF3343 [Orenia marismortui]